MAKRIMQVNYPVAMTRKVTLFHNLTQVHFQKFFEKASSRMASIQGLRINTDSDDAIINIETLFREILDNARDELKADIDNWKGKLESAGFDPDLGTVQGGATFDAPITTPWSNRYLEIYLLCDQALMLIEMAWIAEEITSVIEKRTAVTQTRKPLIDTARQIQRAVTQAFQEASHRDKVDSRPAYPEKWGEAGAYVNQQAPDLISILVDASATDRNLFTEMVEGLKLQYQDLKLHESLDAIHGIKTNEIATDNLPPEDEKEDKKKKAARKTKTVTEEPVSSAQEEPAQPETAPSDEADVG